MDNNIPTFKDLLAEMAFKRDDFQNRVHEYVFGGLREYCKAKIAEKNGHSKWVEHWYSEVDRLVGGSLLDALTTPIRGFSDRKKAFDKTINRIQVRQENLARLQHKKLELTYYKTVLKQGLTIEDFEPFWQKVHETWNDAESVGFDKMIS